MNNKVIAISAVFSLCMISCNLKTTQEIETIVFDYSGTAPVYQYDRVESISLIPLQTDENCLIGLNPSLKFAGDNLFILHGQYTPLERIDHFNTQGQYLNQIGRRGRGPGEFSFSVSDWFFYGDNMVGLRGFFDKNVLLYDFTGNFVHEIQLDMPSSGFGQGGPTFMVGQDSFFFAVMFAQADSPRIIRMSESRTEPKQILRSKRTFPPDIDVVYPFFQTNGKLYYSTVQENAIYKVEQDTIALAFLTDADKYALPQDFYNNPSSEAFNSFVFQNGAAFVYNFLESKNYYVIQLLVGKEESEGLVYGIKHKEKKEWFWGKMETWPAGTRDYSAAGLTEDNRLLMLIPPYSLKEQLPLMKNLLNPHVADSLKDDDNPVLVEIKLR